MVNVVNGSTIARSLLFPSGRIRIVDVSEEKSECGGIGMKTLSTREDRADIMCGERD